MTIGAIHRDNFQNFELFAKIQSLMRGAGERLHAFCKFAQSLRFTKFMASIDKKVRVRLSRCLSQLMELREQCTDSGDLHKLGHCIRLMRESQERIDGVLHGFIPGADAVAAASAPHADAASATQDNAAAAAPIQKSRPAQQVAQPKPGSIEHVAHNKGMAKRMEEDDIVFLPHNMTTEEKVQAMLDGRMGGYYDGEAAKKLYADEVLWGLLNDEERLAKIKTIAEQLERDDDKADEWLGKPDGEEQKPADGVVF